MDTQAEVYVVSEPYYEEHTHVRLGAETVYRGCVYGSKRSFKLGVTAVGGGSESAAGTKEVTLAGAIVAYYAYEVFGERASIYHVVVRNLRTGRVLRRVPTGVPLEATPGVFEEGVGPVRAMVLKSDGAVAWIAYDGLRSQQAARMVGHYVGYFDLYAFDKTGEHLLASGVELEPSSLTLKGSSLSWTEGGKPFSAVLH